MITRKIIEIDKELCNGCGLCVTACHEGAIGLVDGKATLMRDDYCDGLGDCLPVCPTNAIQFVEREALPYNEEEVKRNMQLKKAGLANAGQGGCPGTAAKNLHVPHASVGGCPGSAAKTLNKEAHSGCPGSRLKDLNTKFAAVGENTVSAATPASFLRQWPVQIKLVPVNAPYLNGAKLLIAADCTAFSFGDFHSRFMKGKVTLIGCPKLDEGDYSEKLTQIIKNNDIKSVTVVRMEVPCCSGLANAAMNALKNSGKMIPWQVVTLSVDGEIIDD